MTSPGELIQAAELAKAAARDHNQVAREAYEAPDVRRAARSEPRSAPR